MRRVALLALLALAGCGSSSSVTPEPQERGLVLSPPASPVQATSPHLPEQRYQKPTTSPAESAAKLVSMPADEAAVQVLAGLGRSALAPEHVDLSGGVVVVTYSGSPEGFVDCGTIRFDRAGPAVPATRKYVVSEVDSQQLTHGSLSRELRLDTRMVVAAQPSGDGTSVSVDAVHVVTKTIETGDEVVGSEAITFEDQGSGRFQKGTTCHSTGRLEQLALGGIPGPLVALAEPQGQQLALAQPVSSAEEARTSDPQPSRAEVAPPVAAPPQQALASPVAAPGAPEPAVASVSPLRPAEKRVALVVGNAAYRSAEPLANPVNDSRAVAEALRRLGFVVVEGTDEDKAGMRTLMRRFSDELQDADASLFFYAGHGLQVQRRNYLVPVDATLESEIDLPFEALEIETVVDLMEQTTPMRLVFLDACRDNPLARRIVRSMGQARSMAVGQGLARMNTRVGTLIAFATEPDQVALDGDGAHSPFTEALLRHIETPGIEVRQMLSRVRAAVITSTDGQQLPLDTSALIDDFYFLPTSI